MVRDYETIFILAPTIDEAEAEKVTLKFKEVITQNKGEVVRAERWGKRKLAYEIGRHKKGEYVLLQFRGEPTTVAEVERNYKMTDAVIKFLTIRLEKEAMAHLERLAAAEAAAVRPEVAETPAEAPAGETAAVETATAETAAVETAAAETAAAETPAETPATEG